MINMKYWARTQLNIWSRVVRVPLLVTEEIKRLSEIRLTIFTITTISSGQNPGSGTRTTLKEV